MIPTLSTARLTLRPPAVADFATVAAFFASGRSRYMGGPLDAADAWMEFAAAAGGWLLQGFGYWGIEDRATGRLAGAVGVARQPRYPEDELGWEIYDGFEGRGYATEAAAAARDWALGPRGLTALVSYIHPDNARSIRVAQRLGARLDPDAARQDPEDLVFRHPAPEALP